MHTAHCNCHFSCHTCPSPAIHASLPQPPRHTCSPCHACPPAIHAPMPCMPPYHTCPPATHIPLPHMLPCHACPPAMHASCHVYPPATHAPLPHTPPATHAPLPCWHACPPCGQNSWHTLVKTLPCLNFVAGGKKIVWDIGAYLLITEMCSDDIASNES